MASTPSIYILNKYAYNVVHEHMTNTFLHHPFEQVQNCFNVSKISNKVISPVRLAAIIVSLQNSNGEYANNFYEYFEYDISM